MGKHRTRLKILANILYVVRDNNGVKKTQIMYNAYLSYKLLVKYLDAISVAELVECDSRNCYILTTKGYIFLEKLEEYLKSREAVENNLKYLKTQKSILHKMCPIPDITDC
jgi:predicted transcriptional regulator